MQLRTAVLAAKILQAARYAELEQTALKVLESPTRLPLPRFRVGEIYNTWQDAQHVRGTYPDAQTHGLIPQ